jgi:hypothetical protein
LTSTKNSPADPEPVVPGTSLDTTTRTLQQFRPLPPGLRISVRPGLRLPHEKRLSRYALKKQARPQR